MKKSKWVTAAVLLIVASAAVLTLGAGPAVAENGVTASFTTDPNANFAAFLVSEDLTPTLVKNANFVGQEVTASGLEITLSSAPTAAQTALVAAEATTQAATFAKYNLGADALSVPITFRVVPHLLASLTALTQQLDAAASEWAAKGIVLSSWGPDVTSGRVVVHLQTFSPTAAAALEAAYGDALTVATGDETAAGSSRTADTAPFYGGDKIDQGGTWCTSWFSTISAAGAAVSPTAGHCGAGAWTQNGHTFGTVTSRHFGGSMDGELIPVSSNSATIWSDPTSTTRTVTGLASADTVGVLTCTDGTTDRERCSVRIDATGQSVTYDGQTITGLVKAHQTGGSAAFSAGDSGGPVETTSGSTHAIAQGMIEARVTNDASQGWYMPARTIDSYFNVFVKTS